MPVSQLAGKMNAMGKIEREAKEAVLSLPVRLVGWRVPPMNRYEPTNQFLFAQSFSIQRINMSTHKCLHTSTYLWFLHHR
jgi:hypothetical protein